VRAKLKLRGIVIGLDVAPWQLERPARVRTDSVEMSQSIGEKLRLAREERGIALREISEQTRISIRYLEAIEADDYKRLPGGIFNRSFIRAYAKFVGFDEHAAMEDYVRTLRERGESDDDGARVHQSLVYTEDASSNKSGVRTLILAIIILAALSAAVWAGLHFYQKSRGDRSAIQMHPRLDFASAINRRMLRNMNSAMVKEKNHGCIG
jgi:cytoskeleton protein RodZ